MWHFFKIQANIYPKALKSRNNAKYEQMNFFMRFTNSCDVITLNKVIFQVANTHKILIEKLVVLLYMAEIVRTADMLAVHRINNFFLKRYGKITHSLIVELNRQLD